MNRSGILAAVLAILAAASNPAEAQTGWSDPAGVPFRVGDGGGIVATGPDTIFVVCGGTQARLYRHTVSSATWTRMADAPATSAAGGSVAHPPGSNHIYVWTGFTTLVFARYSIASLNGEIADTWTVLPTMPEGYYTSLAASTTKVYALGGFPTYARFRVFDPDTGLWTGRASAPANIFSSVASGFADPAGNYLYAIQGGGYPSFWRYAIDSNTWISSETSSSIAPLPLQGVAGSAIAPGPGGTLHVMIGSLTPNFYRYTPSTNTWTRIGIAAPDAASPSGVETLPAAPGLGAGMAWNSGDVVHVLRGGSTNHHWRYSIAANRFLSALPPAPEIVAEGGSLAAAGGNLYLLPGGGSSGFYRLAPATGLWTRLGDAPGPVGVGGSLTYASVSGVDTFFVVQGNNTGFWRYSVAAGSWEVMKEFPWGISPPALGACATWDGADRIYIPFSFVGNAEMEIYTISSNTWKLASEFLPAGPGAGGSVAWPGSGDLLYWLPGGVNQDFHAYTMTTDRWVKPGDPLKPADCPAFVGAGGSMAAVAPLNTIYAFSGVFVDMEIPGQPTETFWSYSVDGRSWTPEANPPGTLGTASALTYPGSGPYLYAAAGRKTRTMWRYRTSLPGPTHLGQFRRDGTTPIAAGAAVAQTEVVLEGRLFAASGESLQLQIEVKPATTPFTGLDAELLASAATTVAAPVRIRIPGLAVGSSYHWRARTKSSDGSVSTWRSFNGDTGPDLVIRTNDAPAPAVGQQLLDADGSALPVGTRVTDPAVIRIGALPQDPDGVDQLRLEIEIRTVGTPFSGDPTHVADWGASGSAAYIPLALAPRAYHWQARAVDEWGAEGTWTPFGGNDESQADFALISRGSAGDRKCGQAAGAGPLPLLLLSVLLRGPARARGRTQ